MKFTIIPLLISCLLAAQTQSKKPSAPARTPTGKAQPLPSAPAAPTATVTEPLGAKAITRADLVKNPDTLMKGRKLALLVAVSDYKEDVTNLPNLKYPINDVASVASVLKDQGYRVKILQNANATSTEVRSQLKEVLGMFSNPEESSFLFYFSGHGFAIEKENYLATFGASADNLQQQGISVREIADIMDASGVRQRMAFLDACRNEPGQKNVHLNRSIEKFDRAQGTKIMFSTAPGKFSYEAPNLQKGVFTHYLVEGLNGAAAGPDGFISWDDLKSFIEHQLLDFSMSQNGRSQIPYTTGHSTGDFLLGRRPDGYKPSQAAPNLLATIPVQPPVKPVPSPIPTTNQSGMVLAETSTIRSLSDTWVSSAYPNVEFRLQHDEKNLFVYQGASLLGTLEAKLDKSTKRIQKYEGNVRLAPANGCPDGQGKMIVTEWNSNIIKARIEKPSRIDKTGEIICGAIRFGSVRLLGPEVIFVKRVN